ncbi:MAG: hypothetical protein OXC37_02660 [Bdellovibrionaceae bacterium]|nr:hypothetical protein [Pseudobdellovibrionaceae bacterium]
MLSNLYKLPKPLIAFLVIGGAIIFILLNDPPHTFCDTQVEHFKSIQTGFVYPDRKDFHEEKSRLKRKQQLCQSENTPGACYEYFFYLRKLLKDFRVLSTKCQLYIFSDIKVKSALTSALTLMTALAWRKEVLTGRVSKYNWLNRSDMTLFCNIKDKYIQNYGMETYKKLEGQILSLLNTENKNKNLILKWSILSESCLKYK